MSAMDVIMTTSVNITPRGVANLLGALAASSEDDRELCAILSGARDSINALAWNRFAAATSRATKARSLRRRHQRRAAE